MKVCTWQFSQCVCFVCCVSVVSVNDDVCAKTVCEQQQQQQEEQVTRANHIIESANAFSMISCLHHCVRHCMGIMMMCNMMLFDNVMSM